LTLEELERFYLIQEYLWQPISPVVQSADASRVSRRKMIKRATFVGGFAIGSMFPLVKSIVAPAPGMAAPLSPTPSPTPTPTPCIEKGGDCNPSNLPRGGCCEPLRRIFGYVEVGISLLRQLNDWIECSKVCK